MLCCKRICLNHKDIRSDYKLRVETVCANLQNPVEKNILTGAVSHYRIMTRSHFEELCSYAAGVYTVQPCVQLADMPFVYFSVYFPMDSNLWVLWSLIWIYESNIQLDFSFLFLQFKHTEKKAQVDFSDQDSRTGHLGWWHILTQHDTPCKPEDVWFIKWAAAQLGFAEPESGKSVLVLIRS